MDTPPSNPGFNLPGEKNLEALWHAISTSSLDGLWINSLDGKILHVNDAYCRMSGYSHDEMLHMTIADVEAVENQAAILERTRKVREQGYDRFETRHRTKDGRLLDLEISIRLVPELEVIIAFLRDISETKTYKRNLEAALNDKQNLLDSGNVLIVELNVAGEATFVNSYTTRLTGYSEDELIGKNWFDLLVPREKFPEVYVEFDRLMAGGLPELFENPIWTKDGEEKFISWSNKELRNGDDVVGILSFGIDITEKKQALDDLVKEQKRFATIVETAQDLIWACDLNGNFTYLNPAVKDILGYSADELIGRNFKEITPEDILEEDRLTFEKFLADGTELFNHESLRLAKDGRRVDFLINARAMHDQNGETVGMQGTAKDITASKRYVEELRRAENYQRQIIENAPFGALFYHLVKKGLLIFEGANPAAERILEIDQQSLIGKPILEVFPGLDELGLPEIFERIASKGGVYRQDQVDYDEGHISGAFEIQVFQTGPKRVAVFFSDITERKKNEQELIRAREAALAANRAKDEFLGVMSHELRTPLTPIIGFSEMLAMKLKEQEHKEYLEHIGEAAQRMLRLVEDILQFSRISSKPPEMRLHAFSPASFFQRELKRFEPISQGNSLVISEPDGALYPPLSAEIAVVSDQEILSQILGNLLNNACKFTTNGVITLHYGLESEDNASGNLFFEVEDSGVGISSEDMACIWEPFTQIDSSTSRQFEGVGLGLAICKTLVTHLGGEISLESTPGVGSRFRVRIPVTLQDVSAARQDTQESQANPQLNQKPHILIVEDNDMNRLTLETQVRTLGGTVEHAVDANQALELIALKTPGHYALILLDLHLPGMSGFEFFDSLKSRYTREELPPVVAVSADASENNRQKALARGMQSFIEKPVTLAHLHPILQQCLSL